MRIIKILKRSIKNKWFLIKYVFSTPGTAKWLIKTEIKYGGFHSGIKRNKVSPSDPRTKEQISTGGMRGGDRMLHHKYADKYEKYLKPYLKYNDSLVIVEVGILKGTGLAIWSELFKNSRLIGLDIDLSNIYNNMDNLIKRGAFSYRKPELYEFDQFQDNKDFFSNLMHDGKIDIFIDDGFHANEPIMKTLSSVYNHLADNFVYFIEDNKEVYFDIRKLYPQLRVENFDNFSVLQRK